MKKLLLITTLLMTQTLFAAPTESARCQLREDSLDSNQAVARSEWAKKCFPDLEYQADPDGKFYLFDAQAQQKYLGYPTFVEVITDGSGKKSLVTFKAPIDANAACVDTNRVKLAGFCRAGCYTPDQKLLFADGYQSIGDAHAALRADIASLHEDARLDDIVLQVSEIASYTIDPQEKSQKIMIIETEAGGQLKVTTNHPLVVSTGDMKEASDLEIGEMLVAVDGSFDAIKNIQTIDWVGRVLNVEMASQDLRDNIVIAQGYLNGSVMYQNMKNKEANRKVLRSLVSDIFAN
ncbi:MAG: hypothetical protein KDD33_05045 [Bdellovibrionales bacterium]|nr:hypothetical protein [Bdellovibrionales bacterium]